MSLVFQRVDSAAAGGTTMVIVDYRASSGVTAPAGGDGVATFEFPPVDAGLSWLVERITVMCDSTTPTQAAVYAGSPVPGNFVDGTSRGNFDTADESSPVLVDSSQSLTVQWTGASAGARGTARIQYQVVQRS